VFFYSRSRDSLTTSQVGTQAVMCEVHQHMMIIDNSRQHRATA